jgi:hypothetical protein
LIFNLTTVCFNKLKIKQGSPDNFLSSNRVCLHHFEHFFCDGGFLQLNLGKCFEFSGRPGINIKSEAFRSAFVGLPGFEPRQTEPKSVVLPLYYRPIRFGSAKIRFWLVCAKCFFLLIFNLLGASGGNFLFRKPPTCFPVLPALSALLFYLKPRPPHRT